MTTDITPLETDDAAEPDAGLGALSTSRGNLPLDAVEVRAAIAGTSAGVELTQGFRNPFDVALEATYIFPLPDRAAVTAMRMECAGHVVEGVLKERSQAREEYDQAIAEGRQAAIAEEDRPDVFTMRVGNIAPGERVTVRLTPDPAAALPGRRGDVPVPAGGRAALHPGQPAAGRSGGQRRGRRHRCRPRRLPDQPAGAAARVPEPGPAHAERRHRPGRAAAGRDPQQPARHRGAGRRRRPHDRPAVPGRATGPGFHPPAGRGGPGPDSDLADADPRPGRRPRRGNVHPHPGAAGRRWQAPAARRGAGP